MLVADHAVHGGVRRHGAADLAGEIHRLLLCAARDIVLRTPRGENHSANLICLLNLPFLLTFTFPIANRKINRNDYSSITNFFFIFYL